MNAGGYKRKPKTYTNLTALNMLLHFLLQLSPILGILIAKIQGNN
jgi:hypothetical protein